MRTITLIPSDVPEEYQMASFLEKKFNLTWFPISHRCSIEMDDSFVAVDYDDDYYSQLKDENRQLIVERNLLSPHIAFHIQISIFHSGSKKLARHVLDELIAEYGGYLLNEEDLGS